MFAEIGTNFILLPTNAIKVRKAAQNKWTDKVNIYLYINAKNIILTASITDE
ncbi:hypothetical protein BH10ACI3_BH10ACI3_07080 [soil metagenome]